MSLVKHAHHEFDLDQPGKDSFRHREAGCREVLVTSAVRWALQHELRGRPELTLEAALQQLSPCDLALVEGFKTEALAAPSGPAHCRRGERPAGGDDAAGAAAGGP